MKSNLYRPIGLFDSGVGGLSILQSMSRVLPEYDFVYLADNKHVPFGNLSDEEITRYTKTAIEYLFSIGSPLVILACNTATAVSLRELQHSLIRPGESRRILGIIRPIVEELKEKGKNNVGILATVATVQSGSFAKEMQNVNFLPNITQVACPDLVPLIEKGIVEGNVIRDALEPYLHPLINKPVDTILLGCTHYNFIKNEIQRSVGENISVISEAPVSAEKLVTYLKKHDDIEKLITRYASRKYLLTDDNPHYPLLIEKLMSQPVDARVIQVY